jgi:16S rRNA (cytosine967-C5)-methyltransferase
VSARSVAHAVLGRVFDEGAYTDRAFRAEADRAALDPRDRALAQQLAYGAVQRRATLDHLIKRFSSRPPRKLDPGVRDALRLGLLQLFFLDGIADHAAVSESVELAKGRGGEKLVNAVLRRAQREGRALLDALDDSTPAGAAVKHSHPEWLVSMWWDELGPEDTRALLVRDNEPPESAVRVNMLRAGKGLALPVPAHPAPGIPEGLVLEAPLDVHGIPEFARGELMPQSRASMTVARVLDPQPGERVLDLCAAPGAKTTHIAALMEARGEVVAVESHPGRARALEENARRLGASNVRVVVADAAEPVGGSFDRVLLDPPCSDLGTLQSRPDVRWRKDPAQIERVARQQADLLAAAAQQVRPGGVLVYSTCTISPSENEQQMLTFLDAHPEFERRSSVQLLPHRDGTDGFYIARLERRA